LTSMLKMPQCQESVAWNLEPIVKSCYNKTTYMIL
jgi:hypothetical protein